MGRKIYKSINDKSQLRDEYINILYTFDTQTADATPALRSFRLNDADYSAATFIYIYTEDTSALDYSSIYAGLSTGVDITLRSKDDSSKALLFSVSGSTTAAGSYYKIPVTFQDEISPFQFDSLEEIVFNFSKTTSAVGSSEFADNLFRVTGSSDATKKIALEVDGITSATTRTITMPDNDVDLGLVGGWYGSKTRIKIAPWDVVSYNDKDGVSIQDDGGVVNDAAAKITTMVTGVFIPTGYRATAFMINASANIAVELFESQIDDSTAVSKGSGNANTEVNITNVDSTTTNYLSIIIVEAGNDFYGGYITIEKI